MAGYAVAFTHLSSAVPALAGNARAFPVDLATGAGLNECLASLGPIAAVINCAAVSSPAACERDPVAARCASLSSFLQHVFGIVQAVCILRDLSTPFALLLLVGLVCICLGLKPGVPDQAYRL